MDDFHFIILHREENGLRLIEDYAGLKNCTLHHGLDKRGNFFPLNLIRKIHNSERVNSIFHLPFRGIWYNYDIFTKNYPEKQKIAIIYMSVFRKFDMRPVIKFLEKNQIPLYLIFLDSMDADMSTVDLQEKALKYVKPDHIFTFDKKDAKEYGFHYLNEAYYCKVDLPKEKPEYDLYFIGQVKRGRGETLKRIYDLGLKHGLKMHFDILLWRDAVEKSPFSKNSPGVNIFHTPIHYSKVLPRVNKANCILELTQEGQTAQTLRYFEAVTLNKKLLTNNQNTKNLNFYNKKYMKISDFSEDDIDFSWIKKQEKVDFKYKNEFSPVKVLERIVELNS